MHPARKRRCRPRSTRRPATAEPTTVTKAAKQAAYRSGREAENVVARDLAARGLIILDTNVRLGHLELDIVAREDDTVVVVEVRMRGATAWQSGMESIARVKAKRVRTAGERLWRKRFEHDPSVNRMRFDVAVVTYDETGTPSVEYAKGVF